MCNVPIGYDSEENLESFNKDYKNWRQFHTGKNAAINSLVQPFERALLRSNPKVHEVILKYRPAPKPDKKSLPKEVQNMLL